MGAFFFLTGIRMVAHTQVCGLNIFQRILRKRMSLQSQGKVKSQLRKRQGRKIFLLLFSFSFSFFF
jgi:hypothetical protein